MSEYALYYEASAYSLKEKLMGRQAAGAAFLRAVADTKPERLWCYARERASAKHCAHRISDLGSNKTGIAWIGFQEPSRLREPGLLYRPDPRIEADAWRRLSQSDPRAYSLCGVTHTISTHAIMETIASWLTAPLESWDAVICTSTTARDAVRHILEQQAEYLQERTGARRFTLPQLPVIPLGVHTSDFVRTKSSQAAARARLGISDDEVAFLFAGRLVAHAKAHPLPMYIALEKASQGRRVVLIQAGTAPSKEILDIFSEEPSRLCPSVRIINVDGGDFALYRDAWSAADIFTSLSDNFQETFGITPVEAMAAGLPVVVTDWNGYRDTVRNGYDGFRIPTLTPPAGRGLELADRYDQLIDNFDYYSGYSSQLVAVDVNATTEAYKILIHNEELRRTMGESGAMRARNTFDWSIIFRRYLALWEDLQERRRSDAQVYPPLNRRVRPDRADPFSMFASYPSFHVGPGVEFRVNSGVTVADAIARQELKSFSFAKPMLPSHELIEQIYSVTGDKWSEYNLIVGMIKNFKSEQIAAALVWLSKVGVLGFRQIDLIKNTRELGVMSSAAGIQIGPDQ